PDEGLREVITSIFPGEGRTILVYLEGAIDPSSPPLILPQHTYALDQGSPAEMTSITQEDLLGMIHEHPKILVLP
ncbi:MAG: hypothetical protein ACP5OP_06690, partial [Leptospirillia bacterium]